MLVFTMLINVKSIRAMRIRIHSCDRVFVLLRIAVVFERVAVTVVTKQVYKQGHNYVGFYQKHNTGPLEGYPCAKDQGNVMKCSTSCIQAQFIEQETGNVYTYRDCGTYLLQEFGTEKFNLSYTQYAMILSDVDDIGNTWVFKFCNKEKCLHPSDYEITDGDLTGRSSSESSSKLFIVSCAVVIGIVVGLGVAKVMKVFDGRHPRRGAPPLANVELLHDNDHEPVAHISLPQQ
ncbi:hypothetical protein COOONC_20956 [Cooperia oncophora]